jgi:hypothetical protein
MNPQQVLQNFGSAIRTGSQTVTQLRGDLEGLGQAAQAASMNLTDTSNAVATASQAVQTIGGTPGQGIAFGTQFQSITGLPASVGAGLVTNPFIQSMIALQTGVMPSLQGTLGPTALLGGINSGVAMLSRWFGHSFQTQTKEITNPVTGKPMYSETVTGTQLGDALAAQFLGVDVQTYERMKKYGAADAMSVALTGMAHQYASQVGPAATIKDSTIQRLLERNGYDPYRGTVPAAGTRTHHDENIQEHTPLPAGAHVIGVNSSNDTYKLQMADGSIQTLPMSSLNLGGNNQSAGTHVGTLIQSELAAMQHASGPAGGSSIYWNQIKEQIRTSGLWQHSQNEINRLNKITDPRKRANALNTDISNQMKNAYQGLGQGGNTIQIVMKGHAAKLFKPEPSSITINANSGTGPTLNYQIASPQGASPLMGYTPYDEGQ